jgi:hypothetical protein
MKKLLLVLLLTLTPAALASIWYVDGVNGNDTNDCRTRQTACKTIGHAISLASAGDTIGVGPATYPENLNINVSLKLIGSGASTTIIDGGSLGTVVTASAADVVLSKFTIRNGKASNGGGIDNQGTLTINRSTITGNHATGGGIGNLAGGGIYNRGELTITGSTISGNTASSGFNTGQKVQGGGIYTAGTLTLSNSTVSGNSTTASGDVDCGSAYGGGIYSLSVTLTLSNSTLSGNYASDCDLGHGGGIFSIYGTLQNTIVANSTSGGNCDGLGLTSKGYNLSGDNTCNFSGPGDLNNTNPLLGPLQNNGGSTQTQALLPGSPAIDAGNPNGCTDGSGHLLKTDQRGAPRPDKEDTGGCDIGAFERQSD